MNNTHEHLPLSVDGGRWTNGHVQGITVDTAGKYIYYSFTTVLVKTDLEGNLIGTVEGLLGHLGCIDFNDDDGRVYGSLELKHDSIGKGIMDKTGVEIAEEDSFYIAVFDVDKIDRVGMHAERDGVMTAVYMGEVVRDYNGTDPDGSAHHLGCSGIDGTAFGPVFGSPADSPKMLMVAYGIYGEPERRGNDQQVILQFDWRRFGDYAQPLVQGTPHHSGPEPDAKYYLHTGNTTWGIQNLEYDAFTGDWLVAVYVGKKPGFPNYPMFVIDGSAAPVERELADRGESGLCLTLKKEGLTDDATGISGLSFKHGQTGIYSFGDGLFYVSHEGKEVAEDGTKYHTCKVNLYRRVPGDAIGFELISDDQPRTDNVPELPKPNYIADPTAAGLPTGSASTTLSIHGLSKSLSSRPILHNINLDIMPGEIFGFLGPNGSGKTTTIKLMLGLLHIDEGEIFICGHNVKTEFEPAMANIGGIIENPEMYRYLTGREQLEQYRRMYDNVDKARIDEVVALVGLTDRIDDKIGKYSLGMRQRLGLAQAILCRPRLLVLDEPTNGLDPAGIRDLRDILIKLARTEGVSVFVSSHQLAELELMCDRVGVIDRGVLLGIRTMEELHHIGDNNSDIYKISVVDGKVAERVFAENSATFAPEDGAYRVTIPTGDVPALLKALCVADAGLLSATPVERSLEDAFLEMTRGYASSDGGETK